MNKFLILFLLAFAVFSCTEDQAITGIDNDDIELDVDPLDNIVEDLYVPGKEGASAGKTLGGTANNPIVVPEGDFVDHVVYRIPECGFGFRNGNLGGSGTAFLIRTRYAGIFFGPLLSFARIRTVPGDTEGCFVDDRFARTNPEFEVGLFYEIFGQVVTLSGPRFEDFWVRTDPATGRPQRVNFFANGTAEFGEFVDGEDGNSDPVVIPTPDPDICEGVQEWVPRRLRDSGYPRGTLVVRNGYLMERIRGGWRRIGACG